MSAPASASARRFLSFDWGTSAFRLRLVEVATRRVLAERRGDQGWLASASVLCVGGSWLVPREVIQRKASAALQRNAQQAAEVDRARK